VLSGDNKATDVAVASGAAASSEFFSRSVGWALCLTLLLAVGILRIVSTYHVFNHTIDEPPHLACGIEWWEKGVYRIETKHTPLARISIAFLPYMAGVRGVGNPKNWMETVPILSADGHYWRNLTLARIGVLPFFVIATLVTFFWTKRLYGAPTGLLAAAILTFLPTILAHSAVATTDIAFTAMFCWAMYAFTLWLNEPNAERAIVFGVSSGLALGAKFSTIVFLPACGGAVLVLYVLAGQRNWRSLFRTVGLSLLCAFLVIWAVYRFSHAPLNQVTALPDRVAVKVFGESSSLTNVVHKITSRVPAPIPEIPDGLRYLREQNRMGTPSYIFGQVRNGGFWYFFVVSLELKTPLAVLLFAVIGTGIVVVRYLRDRTDWERAAPLASAVMIMIVTMPSRIDSGVRYVMPVYIFMSTLAALAVATLWNPQRPRIVARVAVVVLLGWMAVSSALSHPDYLPYFNEFGGKDPSRLLVIGDLDWGQDMTRLATYLHQKQIHHISIVYDGFYEPSSLDLPETVKMYCHDIPIGWVAVSARRALRSPECVEWLPHQHRLDIVGKTMWIYYVTERTH